MGTVKCCGNCGHLTNVTKESRNEPNVMGGCFVTGLVTFTDCKGCKHHEPYKDEEDNLS